MDGTEVLVKAKTLRGMVASRLMEADVAEDHAKLVAEILVDAELRGVNTHGVRLLPIYVQRIKNRSINSRPDICVHSSTPNLILVDGDEGLGQIVAQRAMKECLDRAEKTGIAAGTCKRSSHFGAAAYYALLAAERRMIGFATTNGTPAMAPWGSSEPLFGANPFALAVPTGNQFPLVLDMATTQTARAKIRMYAAQNRPIPEGWALDHEGHNTEDAAAALMGSLLPIGGYKGYGIALALEILAGIMSGAKFGRDTRDLYAAPDHPQHIGHFFCAVKIEAFDDYERFTDRLNTLIKQIKSSRPAPGFKEILLPGEIESRTKQERLKVGIPLKKEIHDFLTAR